MISGNFNILLADDDKDDCMFFKEALEELELCTQLTTVYDGAQHYFCKPTDFSELKKGILQVIKLVSKEIDVQPPKETFIINHFKAISL